LTDFDRIASGFLRVITGVSSGLLRKKDVFSEEDPKECGRTMGEDTMRQGMTTAIFSSMVNLVTSLLTCELSVPADEAGNTNIF